MASAAVEISIQEYYLDMELGFLIKKPSYEETIFYFETINLSHFYTTKTDAIYGNFPVAYWFAGMEKQIANRNCFCGRLDISQEICKDNSFPKNLAELNNKTCYIHFIHQFVSRIQRLFFLNGKFVKYTWSFILQERRV